MNGWCVIDEWRVGGDWMNDKRKKDKYPKTVDTCIKIDLRYATSLSPNAKLRRLV